MKQELSRVFDKQKANRWNLAQSSADDRIEKLIKLRKAILKKRGELHTAIYADFKKNPAETDITELYPTIAELNHTIKHLAEWMEPRRVSTPLALFGTSSKVKYEPRGQVLILSPWNYPFNLSMNPLIAAVAAGNCVVMKPSSKVPKTAAFLKDLLSGLFDESEVTVFNGGHDVSDALLELPFDHIFFTGSPRIGKKVMEAAAKNLSTVTLELGGKSPVIVDETANIQKAAERVIWGKFINAGQTCVAPDYLLIHESVEKEFIENAKKVLCKRYGSCEADRCKDENFCRLVSQGHANSLKKILDETVKQGGKIAVGGEIDQETKYLAPTLVTSVTDSSPIMQQEIFGPILPIITFKTLDEVFEIILKRSKPLALYVFSEDKKRISKILGNTTSGGCCVNTAVLHLANPHLPFGGVGYSGMGNYHGEYGFRNLSHERAVLTQGKLDLLQLFYPPYTKTVRKLIYTFIKYLA